ncbi:hypothetical protein GWI33_014427 [Rhynchophorus ferrugineus]|uniref:Uncharacterized protein n=1 Tax=Rhynchophorus ferrugineus TaxID=354439 RepID=A0A834M6W9_RHYFE|nr:hypothetical protein GWI33_014427 [Rhynchophorus ferrugineus]
MDRHAEGAANKSKINLEILGKKSSSPRRRALTPRHKIPGKIVNPFGSGGTLHFCLSFPGPLYICSDAYKHYVNVNVPCSADCSDLIPSGFHSREDQELQILR